MKRASPDLPRAKMRKINIAFDVDGTLRCNCTDNCQDANYNIVALFNILSGFKNIELWVWSAGGADRTRKFAKLYHLPVKQSHCISKLDNRSYDMDIAIDDIQDTALARINLIVRQK